MVDLAHQPDVRPLPATIGRFRVLCELGHGGMATLYLGRALGPGGFERLFAVKLLHEHLSKEVGFVNMFLDEGRIAARIQHPNVVSVYEVGIDKGRHFIAMDYVNGETLALVLRNTWGYRQPLSHFVTAHVIACASEGLHAAHELRGPEGRLLGVVHRDVAPSNIMVGYDGIVRVMDFGVAKARDQLAHTKPGTIKGTLAYMAPEHVRGRTITRRADVWSLGVLLWECLVGKRLFRGRNDIETTARLLRAEVPKPTQVAKGIPEGLEPIVLKALAREPQDRYASARDFSDDLHEFLARKRKRVAPSDLELFMSELFPERHEQRQKLENADELQPDDLLDFYHEISAVESGAHLEVLHEPEEDILIEFDADGLAPNAASAPPASASEGVDTGDPIGPPRGAEPAGAEPSAVVGDSEKERIEDDGLVLVAPKIGDVEPKRESAPEAEATPAHPIALAATIGTGQDAVLDVPVAALTEGASLDRRREPTAIVRAGKALERGRAQREAIQGESQSYLTQWHGEHTEQRLAEAMAELARMKERRRNLALAMGVFVIVGIASYAVSSSNDTEMNVVPLEGPRTSAGIATRADERSGAETAAESAAPSESADPSAAPARAKSPAAPGVVALDPAPEAPPAAAEPVAPGAPAESPRVIVSFETTPKDARLEVDGELLVDGEVELEANDGTHVLTASADGHQPVERSFRADEDKIIRVRLRPLDPKRSARGERPTPSKKKKKKKKKKKIFLIEGTEI